MESYPKMAVFCGLLAISGPFSAKANHPISKGLTPRRMHALLFLALSHRKWLLGHLQTL